jgi:hypothetical protein
MASALVRVRAKRRSLAKTWAGLSGEMSLLPVRAA